ncbi:MAG: hypothetical protein D6702_08260 [Planctomycetota bacterium]|nr:MAG: hypothetical protein D6702_08260 [Planctomycetota bacterium]
MEAPRFPFLVPALLAAAACSPAVPPYVPGLGEIMTVVQMRHAKLWLSGRAGNWRAAAYELDELDESLAAAVLYHPVHKDMPRPVSELVPEMMDGPVRDLRRAVAAEDGAAFATAFDSLTAACNSCHETATFAFNVVVRPETNPFPSQDFRPPAAAAEATG